MDIQTFIGSGSKMMIKKCCVSWKKSTMYSEVESTSIIPEFKVCIYDNMLEGRGEQGMSILKIFMVQREKINLKSICIH